MLNLHMKSFKYSQKAFTIVELLIVIVVIAILAAVSVVAYSGIQSRAATTTLKSDLRNGATQLGSDKATNDAYPASMALADGGKGLSKSSGTTFQYTSNGTSFCLSAISSRAGIPFQYISSTNGQIEEGLCPDHIDPAILANQPSSCPTGFIPVPGNSTFGTDGGFCVMKYEAKSVSGVPTSQAAGKPWGAITRTAASTASTSACSGCHLIRGPEWMTIAANVLSVASNWSGGSVGSGFIYRGHTDVAPATSIAASTDDTDGYYGTGDTSPSDQRRTLRLNNGETIWDLSGNAFEYTSEDVDVNAGGPAGLQPGPTGESTWVYKEWNDPAIIWGNFFPQARPTAISATVGNYTSAQGIGKLYSNHGQTNYYAYIRGGAMGSALNGGVLALMTNTYNGGIIVSNELFSFRVAK